MASLGRGEPAHLLVGEEQHGQRQPIAYDADRHGSLVAIEVNEQAASQDCSEIPERHALPDMKPRGEKHRRCGGIDQEDDKYPFRAADGIQEMSEARIWPGDVIAWKSYRARHCIPFLLFD